MVALKWLDKNFEICCMSVLLAIMTVLSFTNVVMRYCFNNALSWSDEICCYCLAISAFLAGNNPEQIYDPCGYFYHHAQQTGAEDHHHCMYGNRGCVHCTSGKGRI